MPSRDPKTRRDIVVIGTSTGGVKALLQFIPLLPADFCASIFIVMHTAAVGSPALLPQLLQDRSKLRTKFADDGEAIVPGTIYVARPDHHLEVTDHTVRLNHGPKINLWRPAIDKLFMSAANSHGPRTVGLLLTGMLDDGVIGLNSVKVNGGVSVVQEPSEAEAPDMPGNALRNVEVDHCVRLAALPDLLTRLMSETLPTPIKPLIVGDPIPNLTPDEMERRYGPPIPIGCPECAGSLWSVQGKGPLEFRCHVGHAFGAETLAAAIDDEVEVALWSAIRALEEQAALHRRIGQRMERDTTFGARAQQAARNATALRRLVQRNRVPRSDRARKSS